MLATASPAFAQATGVGGNIGTFIQMDHAELIVLRAGLPPVRGRKIVYWRERVFSRRVLPPPTIAPRAVVALPTASCAPGVTTSDDLTLALPELHGLDAPAPGASEAEVARWVDDFIDAALRADPETEHVR
jgi:type IV secretion system protein VirD4